MYRPPRLSRATAKNLRQELGLLPDIAKALAKVLKATEDSSNVHDVDEALEAAEEAIRQQKGGGTFGVEPIRDPDKGLDRYWGDTVALYVNTGDPYNATVVYDVERDVFYCTDWGDWLEAYEHRIGRQVQ
jgi:hypothetical protein